MLKFRLLIALFLTSFASSLCATIEWQSDYKQALELSQKESRPMLLFFNGSDWAGSAMKMKHEILNAASFQEKIDQQFICMEVDFPKHSPLSEQLASQNEDLKNRFKVQELPSLILIDSQERVIVQVGYLPESPEKLAANLLEIVEQDTQLMTGLKSLSSFSPPQLQKLYQLAQELGNQSAIHEVISAGLKAEDPYFFLERYRFLVEKGEMKGEEALKLRQKLCKLGHESASFNGQGIPFTLALIDFQELSQKNYEPETAAQPLVDYLANFAKDDQKNIWRIEMMIAQLYLNADRWEEALKHAEQAYYSAPEAMHNEISHSLDYIRSSMHIR